MAITVQLGMLLLVVDMLQLKNSYGFRQLLSVIFVGFVIHAWSPL